MSAPRGELGRFLRRLPLSVLAAAAIWVVVRPVYEPALCRSAEIAARMVEFPKVAKIQRDDGHALIGRTDLRADSAWLKLSLTQIHFNAVPFLALLFAFPGARPKGTFRRVLVAVGVLLLSHVLALVANVKVFYAADLGSWSQSHYSDTARALYGALRYFFDIPVTFTLPLLLWVGVFRERVLALAGMAVGDAAPRPSGRKERRPAAPA
ncbi:MAG: hypothetical protein HXY19_06550 [Thermoanaerobaculaceae bacterium]|nr:hypothetical protein [Thermoanaerobaculaceae bacterium]